MRMNMTGDVGGYAAVFYFPLFIDCPGPITDSTGVDSNKKVLGVRVRAV